MRVRCGHVLTLLAHNRDCASMGRTQQFTFLSSAQCTREGKLQPHVQTDYDTVYGICDNIRT